MKDKLLIRDGRILDPCEGRDEVADLLVEGGRVSEIGHGIRADGAHVIDASGLLVVPGFVDIHVHLREPGREDKETIHTGTRSAAAGGFTTVCCMPNTEPTLDTGASVNYIRAVAARDGIVNVYPIAAMTRGRAGEEMAELGDLAYHGAIAYSDDGAPVRNAEIMRRALQYTAMLDKVIMNHSEVLELVGDGVAHHGEIAERLGLRTVPSAAESVCVARDIELADATGGHVHICHVSTARACELIADAKRRGVRVTAEVTPHHLVLTDEAIAEFDTMARVSPPLRSAEDRAALREALRDGTIDCVATDHAPHTDIEKDQPFDQAPPGMIGLDFAFALLYTELVQTGFMPLELLIRRMTCDPARILHLKAGRLREGDPADIAILDLNATTPVIRKRVFSKSFNTPFRGRTFNGAVAHTIVAGQPVYRTGEIIADVAVGG